MEKPGSPIDAAIQSVVEESEVEALKSQIFNLKAQVANTTKEKKALNRAIKEKNSELLEVLVELELYQRDYRERPDWLKTKKKGKEHHGSLVAFLSDAHITEVVRPEEIGGYNKYNMAIAEMRIQAFFERTITVARNYLAGVKYDGIVLPLGGDLVSGDIHQELVETNEYSTMRGIELSLPWFLKGIEMFHEEFGNVHIVSAPGNHGRNSLKPRHKKRSENNADTHIAQLLAMVIGEVDGITFDIPEGADVDFKVYDSVFSMEHGDNLRFNGTSEIG